MKNRIVVSIVMVFWVSMVALRADEDVSQKVPNPITSLVKSYFDADSKKDAEAYQALYHPNSKSDIVQRKKGWALLYNTKTELRKVVILHSDDDKIIAEVSVHTNSTRGETLSVDEAATYLFVFRAEQGDWKIWLTSLLDTRKLG